MGVEAGSRRATEVERCLEAAGIGDFTVLCLIACGGGVAEAGFFGFCDFDGGSQDVRVEGRGRFGGDFRVFCQ